MSYTHNIILKWRRRRSIQPTYGFFFGCHELTKLKLQPVSYGCGIAWFTLWMDLGLYSLSRTATITLSRLQNVCILFERLLYELTFWTAQTVIEKHVYSYTPACGSRSRCPADVRTERVRLI